MIPPNDKPDPVIHGSTFAYDSDFVSFVEKHRKDTPNPHSVSPNQASPEQVSTVIDNICKAKNLNLITQIATQSEQAFANS